MPSIYQAQSTLQGVAIPYKVLYTLYVLGIEIKLAHEIEHQFGTITLTQIQLNTRSNLDTSITEKYFFQLHQLIANTKRTCNSCNHFITDESIPVKVYILILIKSELNILIVTKSKPNTLNYTLKQFKQLLVRAQNKFENNLKNLEHLK